MDVALGLEAEDEASQPGSGAGAAAAFLGAAVATPGRLTRFEFQVLGGWPPAVVATPTLRELCAVELFSFSTRAPPTLFPSVLVLPLGPGRVG